MANASSSATPIAVERANTNGYTVIELIVAMALISGAMAIGGWFGHRLIQHCAHTRRDCDMLLNLMDFTSTLRRDVRYAIAVETATKRMLKLRWRNSVIIYQMHHRADNGINAVVTRTVMRKRRVTARDEWHWQGDISFQSVMKWRGMLATIAVNSPRGRKWTLHITEVCTHGTRSP